MPFQTPLFCSFCNPTNVPAQHDIRIASGNFLQSTVSLALCEFHFMFLLAKLLEIELDPYPDTGESGETYDVEMAS